MPSAFFSGSFLAKRIGSLNQTGMREVTGPMEFRTDDPGRKIWLIVDTVIRYVMQMRNQATEPAARKNGDESLAKRVSTKQ
jgi:hypothetical protein